MPEIDSEPTVEAGQSQPTAEPTPAPDAASSLEATVGARLDALKDAGDGIEEENSVADDTVSEDGEVADDPSESVDPAAEAKPPPSLKGKGPVLPDSYRRTLRAYEWPDEDIDAAFKADPINFTATAAKLHSSRNKELAQWAEIGRTNRPGQQPQAQKEDAAPKFIDPKTGRYQTVSIEALAEKHGNREVWEEIVGPFNAALEEINSILPDLRSGVQHVQQSRQNSLAQQIDSFFGGKDLEPFHSVYGKDHATLTEEQGTARGKVLELADALIAGAAHQGRRLNVNEAMLMAHDHVAGSFKVQAARSEIKKAVTKRANSISLKPSKGGGKSEGAPKNDAEFESRVKQRLASLRN